MASRIMSEIMQIVESREMPQKELAEKAGIGESSISRWLHGIGQPKIEEAERLADALGYELWLVAK